MLESGVSVWNCNFKATGGKTAFVVYKVQQTLNDNSLRRLKAKLTFFMGEIWIQQLKWSIVIFRSNVSRRFTAAKSMNGHAIEKPERRPFLSTEQERAQLKIVFIFPE